MLKGVLLTFANCISDLSLFVHSDDPCHLAEYCVMWGYDCCEEGV